ncbi:hypothetical protein [Paenirhodobacter sp.]|uniref:hypothetical protein n=1 Tax=Paenirhodobacter sp. TaxID=1965326 RepID=UPI003B40C542
MRFPLILTAVLAGTAAQAGTITDPAADVALWGGDIIATATAPVSADIAVDDVFLSGGPGQSYALSIGHGGTELLFAETGSYSYDGDRALSFLFDLNGDATFGDWLKVTYTFAEPVSDGAFAADMTVTWGADLPAVPLPATLPLLICALAGGAALRRKA